MNIYRVYFKNGTVLEIKAIGCRSWKRDGKLSSVDFIGCDSQEVEYINCSEVLAITSEEVQDFTVDEEVVMMGEK